VDCADVTHNRGEPTTSSRSIRRKVGTSVWRAGRFRRATCRKQSRGCATADTEGGNARKSNGWSHPSETSADRRGRKVSVNPILTLKLEPGDFITHRDHGVGKFQGLVRRTVNEVEREYLLPRVRHGDKLYVPRSGGGQGRCLCRPERRHLTRLCQLGTRPRRSKQSPEKLARELKPMVSARAA